MQKKRQEQSIYELKAKKYAKKVTMKALKTLKVSYFKPFFILLGIILLLSLILVASYPSYNFNSMYKTNPKQSEAPYEEDGWGLDALVSFFRNLILGEEEKEETANIETVYKQTNEVKDRAEKIYSEVLEKELKKVKKACEDNTTDKSVYSYSKTISEASSQLENATKINNKEAIYLVTAASAKTENFIVNISGDKSDLTEEERKEVKKYEEDKLSNKWFNENLNKNEVIKITILEPVLYRATKYVNYYYYKLDVERKYFEQDYEILLGLEADKPLYPRDEFSPTVEEYIRASAINNMKLFEIAFAEFGPSLGGDGSEGGGGGYYEEGGGEVIYVGNGKYGYPLEKVVRVTSEFGWRNVAHIPGATPYHPAIDLGAKYIKALAVTDGSVISSGWQGGRGITVKIKNNDGTFTIHQHLNKSYVKVGDKVIKGQVIAQTGNTGVGSGAHLHFEFHDKSGTPINPRRMINF